MSNDKLTLLINEIETLKNKAIEDYVQCEKDNGENHLVCNIHSGQVMAYGIVINKIKNNITK